MAANKAVVKKEALIAVTEDEPLTGNTPVFMIPEEQDDELLAEENRFPTESAVAIAAGQVKPTLSKAYADDAPRNLYAVIYPGKFLTATVMELGIDPASDSVIGSLFWTAYEASSYTERGIPDFARLRRFCSSFSAAVNNMCVSLNRNLTAVLVRTPPPAAAFASATNGNNPEYLQCNTFFEGFAVGMLFGLFPHTPTWYCHPNAIRALFSEEGEPLKMWTSREQEAEDVMEMATNIIGTPLRHEREAGCVLAAAHHYTKFSQGLMAPVATAPAPVAAPAPSRAAHARSQSTSTRASAGAGARPVAAASAPIPPPPKVTVVAPVGAVWGGSGGQRVMAPPSVEEITKVNAPIAARKVVVQKFEEIKKQKQEKLKGKFVLPAGASVPAKPKQVSEPTSQ